MSKRCSIWQINDHRYTGVESRFIISVKLEPRTLRLFIGTLRFVLCINFVNEIESDKIDGQLIEICRHMNSLGGLLRRGVTRKGLWLKVVLQGDLIYTFIPVTMTGDAPSRVYWLNHPSSSFLALSQPLFTRAFFSFRITHFFSFSLFYFFLFSVFLNFHSQLFYSTFFSSCSFH